MVTAVARPRSAPEGEAAGPLGAAPAFADLDDATLVERARTVEPRAFGELFERWYDRCYDVAWNLVRDRETAADVAQDAFCACWEHLAQLRDTASFGGWVLRT